MIVGRVEMLSAMLGSGDFWMPVQAAEGAAAIDWVFYFIFWISLVFFLIIALGMFYFMVRYRRRTEDQPAVSNISHNTPLELVWTIIPAILLVPMFWWGFTGFMHSRIPPKDAYDINVSAQRWKWDFIYPNGHTDSDLHVPGGTPVRLVMQSTDVIHSLFIPAFRVKRDLVPGRYSMLWFNAKNGTPETLVHRLYCTEYCGTSHSDMKANVYVHPSKEDFLAWLANADPLKKLSDEQYGQFQKDPDAFIKQLKASNDPNLVALADKLLPPAEMGKRLFEKKSCNQCHSITKAPGLNGPSWYNVYGHEVALRDGSKVMADENYLRESIVNPSAKIVAGYTDVMGPQRVTSRDIDMLIAFIKTLTDEHKP